MSKTCTAGQNNIEVLIATDQANERAIDDTKFLANPDFDLAEIILKDMGKEIGEEITEEEMNDVFKKIYNERYGKVYKLNKKTGKEEWTGEIKDIVYLLGGQASARSILLAGKITALLQSNPHLYAVFEPYIMKRIPEGVQVDEGTGQVHLAVLPVPTLKNIYAQIHGMVNRYSGGQPAHASFKGFVAKLTTPGQMIYKDPSGALSIIQKATRDYPDIVASRIAVFMNNPEFLPDEIKYEIFAFGIGKSVDKLSAKDKRIAKKTKIKGMADILKEVALLEDDLKVKDWNSKDRLMNIFTMLMRGEVSLEHLKNGELMIYKDYKEVRDENGKIVRHDRKGTEIRGVPVKSFQNLEPLKDHTPVNRKKGEWNVEFTDGSRGTLDMFKALATLVKQARTIENAAWLYAQREMKGSLDTLYSKLKKSINLHQDDLKTLFFRVGTERHKNLVKHLKRADPEGYKLYEIFSDTFGMLVSHEVIISNGGVYDFEAPSYMENHWPTLYQKDDLRLMLDMKEAEITPKIKLLEDEGVKLKSLRQLYLGEKKGTTTEKEWDLYNKKGQLNSIQAIRSNMDNYHVDLNHNTLIPIASDNKHFKRLSTAYDIRAGRRDDGVYYDYLKNIMSTIQRNYMAANLVEAITLIHKSKRIPDDEKEGIMQYTVNLFKVPFHTATIKGIFGISDEGISKRIKSLGGGYFFKHFSPAYVTSKFKSVLSKISAMFLPGILTSPITNLTGAYQNINDYGRAMTKRGLDILKNPDYKDGIERMITLSGIAEFSDFFSRSMVNGIVKVQLSQDTHWLILKEQLLYHKNVRKMGEKKAKELFIKNVEFIFSQSDSYLKAEDIEVQDRERIKARQKQLRIEMKVTNANKLLEFAIDKEIEFKTLIRGPGVYEYVKKGVLTKVQSGGKLYAGLVKLIAKPTGEGGKLWTLTMSNTEKFVRSLSFVIGVQRAWDSGLLNRKEKWWAYTNKEDIEKAIRIGKEYAYFTNFGMSTQAVGAYNYSGFGNMIGKFKYWSQQKAGRDLRIFRDAYRSLKSDEKIEGTGKYIVFKHFDSKALGKLLLKLFRPGFSYLGGRITGVEPYQQRLRKTHPEVAALRTFLTTQVLMTFIWDVALGGPLRFAQHIPIIGKPVQWIRAGLWKTGGGGQMKNATSDVASLMMLPFVLATRYFLARFVGFDDDDETLKKADRMATYYLRRIPFLGYLPMVTFDRVLAAIYALAGEEKMATEKTIHAYKVYLGAQMPGAGYGQEGLEGIIEYTLDR